MLIYFKEFKELISLHSDKIKDLSSYEYYFQNIEEDIEDEDENDLDYLETLHFKDFLIEYNINQLPTINNLKRSIINNLRKLATNNNSEKQPVINNLEESTINNNLKEQRIINNNLEEQPIINNNLEKSTFIKTPEWLRLKRSVLNPNNKDNKCFQYSGPLSLYHKQIEKTFVEYQLLNHLSIILIGKILIFHRKNKIINNLK